MLIGLDLSNRMPLLNVLNNRFADHQIFMLTFDRTWFEIAKEHLTRGWTACEIYVGEHTEQNLAGQDEVKGNKPVIVQPSDDLLTKATKYFSAYDYPAAANYLRKECERLIKKALPFSYKVYQDAQYGSMEIKKLETLIDKLTSLFKDCEEPLPPRLEHQMAIYKKAVLNPMSHHDLESPIYKSEVKQLFDLVNELTGLPELKRQIELKAESILTYEFRDADRVYRISVECVNDLYSIAVNGHKKFSSIKYRINSWTLNGIEFSNMNLANNLKLPNHVIEQNCTQQRTFDEIVQGVFGVHSLNIAPPADVFAVFKVDLQRSLRDMLT